MGGEASCQPRHQQLPRDTLTTRFKREETSPLSHNEDTAAAAHSQAAVVQANRAAGKPKSAEPQETPLEALASICTVLVVGLFVMAFIFQNFEIPSASMEQTLLIGDHVVVDRSTLTPSATWMPLVYHRPVHHGDIIVFLKPNPESPDLILVKRAIGLPGDHIHLEHGTVFINGVAQNMPFAVVPQEYNPYRDDFPRIEPGPDDQLTELWRQDISTHIENNDLVVPPGMVFAMGDNRPESLDSRYWGFVPQQNIMGRPMFVYWSFKTPADEEDKTSMGDRISFMFHVLTHIFTGTRWSRTFHVTR
jgi:signal peptidase I